MILDTEFLIALDDQDPAAIQKKDELQATGAALRVPTVVIQELYVGVGAGAQSFANAQKYEALVANLPVVELDETIARQAGALQGLHIASETKPNLGDTDAVIAATGLQYTEPVVTDDEDYEHVDGLSVELL